MGRIVFSDADLHPNSRLANFSIGEFSGNRDSDDQRVMEYLNSIGYNKMPEGYALHHDINNGDMQFVRQDTHKSFSHYGGHYYNKPK
jgi:hypothetical protein